jgi:hypothetical protein
MPANSRLDLIRGLMGYRSVLLFHRKIRLRLTVYPEKVDCLPTTHASPLIYLTIQYNIDLNMKMGKGKVGRIEN